MFPFSIACNTDTSSASEKITTFDFGFTFWLKTLDGPFQYREGQNDQISNTLFSNKTLFIFKYKVLT